MIGEENKASGQIKFNHPFISPILGEPKGDKKDGNIKHVYHPFEWGSQAGSTSVSSGSKNTTYYRSLIYNV
ncbi:MAG: hypothetical protein ISR82_05140 [Candidatus Marinimicrobia bacterium]|nr:hypothetical protein [Candidatus Neomarinimicrobiota bacterium]MBL7010585.1 hypothetical protein [Candidatus Neomarinimicrobiota bacterium]MBL7031080.1 hypothetical protein [Candidatus Neomarinimicrobiota bacterium]